jgi:hypothetical protein
MACYEEDHLISLENGGNPTDPRNLWPEPYNTMVGGVIMGAHQKDVVEGFIHDEICHDIPGARKNSYIPATTCLWRIAMLTDPTGDHTVRVRQVAQAESSWWQ